MKKLTAVLTSFSLLCSFGVNATSAAENTQSANPANTKFFHVSADKILSPENEEFTIKGISFGNSVWSEPETPSKTHHTELSYKEISEMGFNCVRFYLNYNLFEDDDEPYKYKQSGFDWIDLNIKWAKKYGIKLILNMHVPQGGFQSMGGGMALWTETGNLKRLSALWAEIAKRYKNEPAIIGYGLINEPGVPLKNTVDESLNIFTSYIKSLAKTVRTADKNHIIFVEKPLMIKNLETGKTFYSNEVNFSHFLLDDSNVVYEFHDYAPHQFTHQDTDWANTKGAVKFYPSSEVISYKSDDEWLGCEAASNKGTRQSGWEYYESTPVKRTSQFNMGRVSCQAFGTGKAGTAYFDEIKISEYDKDGNKTDIILVNPSDKPDFWFWSSNGSGSFGKSSNTGFGDKTSLYIKGTTDDSIFSGKPFELKEGFKYVISAWVKRENCADSAITNPRIDFINGADIHSFNKQYLESNMQENIKFGRQNNVPVYLGEFGVVSNAYVNDRGALQWVRDMISLCEKYGVHFNYHTYHEESFGLYMNSDYELPNKLNTKLAALFKSIL
ncbi:MAG: glycoside hydrolase family 5 protein [Clostridiales bacterium]|jgi:endoglucanase|nr:glycoside hydrolase family 5 protein [Clostridiales bacterium]